MRLQGMKRIVLLLVFGILLSAFWNLSSTVAEAATPKLKHNVVEIAGTGEVYQLTITNKVKKSKYQWSSSNNSVATVANNGLITSVNKGNTTIKCKITYPSGKTKNLYCKVTVTIPSTDIEINNATITNGAHVMLVGDSYDFNETLTPSNSTDKTYWSLDASDDESNPNAVRIVDSSKGKVTALRRGKIVLVATAAKESSAASAKKSEIRDAVIIEVVGPSPEVISAEIVNTKEVKVVFGTAIKESTVVTNGVLSSNIDVARLISKTGETAKDPGTLMASLSGDLKTLTITASNYFNGDYNFTFTKSILSTEGAAIYQETKKLSYSTGTSEDNTGTDTSSGNTNNNSNTNTNPNTTVVDTTSPEVESIELDDTGMITKITFKEKMDFSGFKVADAKLASGTVSVQASTISFLNTESNYIFSSDGKSIWINLSGISADDYDKSFVVTISGVTDTSGNRPVNDSITVGIRTQTAPRAQARPISVIRTSYDTITATFDRAIRTPGYAMINNGGFYYGKVNLDNNKQVDYKLSAYDAMLTGNQKISIGHWDSYNVMPTDTYANNMYDFNVFFITETDRPNLVTYQFDSNLNIITLTFSENVKLNYDSGSLAYSLASNSNSKGLINYSKVSGAGNVIEIMVNNLTIYGNYTITLPDGFVLDDYRNLSYSRTISLDNGNGAAGTNVLAEPYSIHQSTLNHSLIYIQFADKLDVAAATDANNYSVAGTAIQEVQLISNTTDGSVVLITVGKGTITSSGKRRISVTGLKGYNGSSSTMANYSTDIDLVENKDPELKSITYDAASKNTIKLTFTETVKGVMIVSVQERSTGYAIGNTATVSGDTVLIKLSSTPADGTYLMIYVQENRITDLSGNESTINPVYTVFANY